MQLSQITVGGPCRIVTTLGVIYTEGDTILEPVPTYRNVESAVVGSQDKVLVDLFWRIKFKPKSIWTSVYRSILAPSAYYNYTTAGTRMIGNSNLEVSIVGADGAGFTFTRAKTTTMSSIYCGLGNSVWGDCEMTAFIGEGKALSDSDAFMTVNATAWDQSDYPTTHQEALCTAAWGAVTGWSTVYAEGGFQLNHELETDVVKQGGITVDMKILSYRASVAFKPQQPTTAQLLTALNPTIGSRRSGNAANLVIAASGFSVTAHSVAVEKTPFHFDAKTNRHGEILMVTAMTGPGTRLTLA